MTWDSLAFQPEFTATASNIGYSQWSHDIGGHMFGVKASLARTATAEHLLTCVSG